MKIQVRYYSKGGNTKKLADCIAKTAGVQAQAIEDGAGEEADILFLGASVYWGGIDGRIKSYMEQLDPEKFREVVVFSTSALAQRAFPAMQKSLEKKGIQVADESFYCRGEFTALHRGRPNQEDLEAAARFTRDILRTRS